MILLHKKFMNRPGRILLSRDQDGRWEMAFIRRIWKMLCFQTETVMFLVDLAGLSCDRAVKEISRIKLDAGLDGEDFHDSTARRLIDPGRRRNRPSSARQNV